MYILNLNHETLPRNIYSKAQLKREADTITAQTTVSPKHCKRPSLRVSFP